MSDAASHGAPQPDNVQARHTLTVREVEVLLANAGVQRSHRHVLRLCQSAMLDAVKILGPSGEEWYIAPDSVPKAIGDLKQIDTQRARRAAPQPATSDHVTLDITHQTEDDTPRPSTPQPDTAHSKNKDDRDTTQPAMARHGVVDLDIYEHPYVKRLENQVEKLEGKLEAQVRRTEEIQLTSQKQLLELQRMTAVGNSQTLADFMLRAKDWVLGSGTETDKTGDESPVNS